MKFVIFKRNGEEIGERINSYEASIKDDTSNYRPEDQAEPKAIHLSLPEGLEEDCVIPMWMELEEEQTITLREPIEATEDSEAVEGLYHTIPAVMGWGLVEDADKKLVKRQVKANSIRDELRLMRAPLLIQADHAINSKEDDGEDSTSMRAWRKALRECLDSLSKVDGNAKLSCENMTPSEFVFPVKPE